MLRLLRRTAVRAYATLRCHERLSSFANECVRIMNSTIARRWGYRLNHWEGLQYRLIYSMPSHLIKPHWSSEYKYIRVTVAAPGRRNRKDSASTFSFRCDAHCHGYWLFYVSFPAGGIPRKVAEQTPRESRALQHLQETAQCGGVRKFALRVPIAPTVMWRAILTKRRGTYTNISPVIGYYLHSLLYLHLDILMDCI